MNQRQLPYLHYMLRADSKAGLISPAEVDDQEFFGGCFVAPLRDDGRFFPIYRFDFSLYLGEGHFLPPSDGRTTFNGIAIAVIDELNTYLHCTFEYPSVRMPSAAPRQSPGWFFEPNNARIEPLFRRVRNRSGPRQYQYAGSLRHRDFKCEFAELEPCRSAQLDELLDRWGVSIIGCAPTIRYSGLSKRPAGKMTAKRG